MALNKFVFLGKELNYFSHPYNSTYRNERAIEIPIIHEILKKYSPKDVLEIGNVLSHYYDADWDILDKYETGENVINEDIVDFKPSKKYKLIVSISTFEHVGLDESKKDEEKVIRAIKNVRDNILCEGGLFVITTPIGYAPSFDFKLFNGALGFNKNYYLKRTSQDNQWTRCNYSEVENTKYSYNENHANAITICANKEINFFFKPFNQSSTNLSKKEYLKYFDENYGKKLNCGVNQWQENIDRHTSFRKIFEELLNKKNAGFTIIETGCTRGKGWTDGNSSLLFFEFLSNFGGKLISIDISKENIGICQKLLEDNISNKSKAEFFPIVGNSLDELKKIKEKVDLIYLDSFDIDINNPMPSMQHALKELKSAKEIIQQSDDLLLVIDDNFERSKVGKGKYILEWAKETNQKILLESYQIIIKITNKEALEDIFKDNLVNKKTDPKTGLSEKCAQKKIDEMGHGNKEYGADKLYWDEGFVSALENWGIGNAWDEIQLLLANKKGRVLDVACGTGKVMQILSKYKEIEVHGFDISNLLIQKAIEKDIPKERLSVCDASKLTYSDNSFDFSYSMGSLEHIPEKQLNKAISEIARVTKKMSFNMVPVSRSGTDTGWINEIQSFYNNSIEWWLKKFRKNFSHVYALDSKWESINSTGKWLVCIKQLE